MLEILLDDLYYGCIEPLPYSIALKSAKPKMKSVDQSGADEAVAKAKAEAEVAQTTRAPLRVEPRRILDGEHSDLNQKIQLVLRNLRLGRHAPLLQFWTLKQMDSPFVLQTQSSHALLVTPNDELLSYWDISRVDQMRLPVLPRVSMCDAGWRGSALANLFLPVYSPVSEPGLYEEYCVGILQIVSNTNETCLQFFKDAGVCDLFQHDVSTQGGEVPSNDFVDNTEQFTPEGVLYDKDQFVRWARDVYKNDGVVLVIRSSKDDKIYFRCERPGESAKKKNGQTSSKKCNCPFQIVGSKKKNGIWSLRKIDGSHNH
ncbi:unnamed protein product [Camellia sinensis]